MNVKIDSINWEGVICGEKFSLYSRYLLVNDLWFYNKKVLNFGSGTSCLQNEFKNNGIECLVVDYDIDKESFETENAGSENRNCVLGSKMRPSLPFKDGVFDYVLVFKVTYQNSYDVRENIYRELMRVGSNIHIAPIFYDDIELIEKILKDTNTHRIVYIDTLLNTKKYNIDELYDGYFGQNVLINKDNIKSIEEGITVNFSDDGIVDNVEFKVNKCGLIILEKVT